MRADPVIPRVRPNVVPTHGPPGVDVGVAADVGGGDGSGCRASGVSTLARSMGRDSAVAVSNRYRRSRNTVRERRRGQIETQARSGPRGSAGWTTENAALKAFGFKPREPWTIDDPRATTKVGCPLTPVLIDVARHIPKRATACNDEKEFCPMSRRTGWPVLLLFFAFASADQVTIERDPRGGTKRLEKVAPLQGVSAFRADGANELGPDETSHRTQRHTGSPQDPEWGAPGLIPRRATTSVS
jgi:hypothetical protein